jgi:hypothetical protein
MSNPSAEKEMRRKRRRLRPFLLPIMEARERRLDLQRMRQEALMSADDTPDVADCIASDTPKGVLLNTCCTETSNPVTEE